MKAQFLLSLFVAQALAAVYIGEVNGPAKDGLYIVVFKDNTTAAIRDSFITKWTAPVRFLGGQISEHTIGDFNAISGKFTTGHVSRLLQEDAVAYVEPNKEMKVSASCTKETDTVTWGLERLNDRATPAAYSFDYSYSNDASNVDAYILDTGIEVSHPQFEGRAVWGTNTVDTEDRDCQGHGTHVAGTVGSKTYGVAKKVSLFAVKFLGCDGSGSNIGMINGMEWIHNNAQKRKRPSVVNVSAGGGYSRAVNDAMAKAIAQGVTYVVAAGNEAQDACKTSPASVSTAITVGATDKTDKFAYFSNFGTCVDILAPGVDITSTWIGGKTNKISGTSMACPHAAGVSALILATNPTYSPAQVTSAIVTASTPSVITSVPKSTVNKLAYVSC